MDLPTKFLESTNNEMRHLDLFSGIGGFALAAQWVWGDEYENVGFCDNNKFCQAVFKKNFPNAKIYGDIRELSIGRLVADADRGGRVHAESQKLSNKKGEQAQHELAQSYKLDLLTGGFPCQPFSFAGKRRGKEDDRYLWPHMLRIIQETRPRWIIGENVAGIVNLALDQVLADLEAENYEVQPFIIPAAPSAPRIGEIGFGLSDLMIPTPVASEMVGSEYTKTVNYRDGVFYRRSKGKGEDTGQDWGKFYPDYPKYCLRRKRRTAGLAIRTAENQILGRRFRVSWLEAATALCGVDDGLPAELDGLKFTAKQHRVERIKSLGNAIVPHVAAEIMGFDQRADLRDLCYISGKGHGYFYQG